MPEVAQQLVLIELDRSLYVTWVTNTPRNFRQVALDHGFARVLQQSGEALDGA